VEGNREESCLNMMRETGHLLKDLK